MTFEKPLMRSSYRAILYFLIFLVGMYLLVAPQKVTSEESQQSMADQNLCGPLSLQMVCQLLGKDVPVDQICHLAKFDADSGTTMYGLADAAYQLGFKAVGMRIGLKDLMGFKQPVIAFVRGNHFLVVEKTIGDQLRVIDPGHPPSLMSQEDFGEIWQGETLVVSKREFAEGNQPDIRFDHVVHNYGSAHQKETIIHSFAFKNVGNVPLVISEVKSSCACTATLLSDKEIPPGGHGAIEVRFATELWRGERTVNVRVYSNDPDEPVVILTLTGNVAGWIAVIPNALEVGDIRGNQEIQRKLEVFDPGHGKLRLKGARTTSPCLTVEILPQTERHRFGVSVALQPGLPLGPFEERISLLTNDARTPEVEVWVRGNVRGDVLIFPKQFFFGFLDPRAVATREVTITNEGQESLEILKVVSPWAGVRTEVVPLEQGKAYVVKAIWDAGDRKPAEGVFKGIIQVHTNYVKQALLELPVRAIIR